MTAAPLTLCLPHLQRLVEGLWRHVAYGADPGVGHARVRRVPVGVVADGEAEVGDGKAQVALHKQVPGLEDKGS